MTEEIVLRPGDNILVCRTDRLGDLILSLPLIESLKICHPQCHVDVMASAYAAPILKNNESIDNVIRIDNKLLINDGAYRRELRSNLSESTYKVAVVLYPERKISRIIYQTGIPIRIGTARRFHSIFFNRHLFHSRKANRKHESEYNLDFLRFFKPGKKVIIPRINVIEEELSAARALLRDVGAGDDFVVLHPGSKGSADSWPLGQFVELCYILSKEKLTVVLTGSSDEREQIERAVSESDVPVINLIGKTDLRTLAGVLALSALVVANSTGPLHLAAAVGTRVVGLYPGKRAMSPIRWGPLGEGHRVILPPEGDNMNMKTINPAQVAEAVLSMVRNSEVSQ